MTTNNQPRIEELESRMELATWIIPDMPDSPGPTVPEPDDPFNF